MVGITESEKIKTQKISSVLPLAAVAGLSVVMALAAVFALAGWAEASLLGHGTQHVLLFLAGLGFGTSMLTIYKAKDGAK